MDQASSIENIAAVIQLAVAPVFLLAGIAGILNVLTTRLGRIVDRARVIERRLAGARQEALLALLQSETASLWRRIRLINWSIRLCVLGALMVCLVIVTLFIGDFATYNLANLIAALFVSAMLLVVLGLIFFLVEVGVSTHRMRQGLELALEEAADAEE